MEKDKVDRVWITQAGLPAISVLDRLGFRRGYVGVPKTHVLYGIAYDKRLFANGDALKDVLYVDSGLAWSGDHAPIKLSVVDGLRSMFRCWRVMGRAPYYWYGFDTGAPSEQTIGPEGAQLEADHAAQSYKTAAYVAHYCEDLAHQLQRMNTTNVAKQIG